MMSPLKFFSQVKLEGTKITWPTRSETISVTIVVMVLVAFASLFFTVADWLIYTGISTLLGY